MSDPLKETPSCELDRDNRLNERLRSKLPAFRCDNCDNGVELEWEFCAWCGATKDWAPANQQNAVDSK